MYSNFFWLPLYLCLIGSTFVINGVPFIKQETAFCGPAILSSVFQFYGENVDHKKIAEEIYSDKLKGTLITDMENYAKKRGFRTKLGCGSIEDIKSFLLANKPVIALVDIGLWFVSKQHYLVIFGYNDEGIIVHDGLKESRHIPYEEFRKIWKKAGSCYLVISR